MSRAREFADLASSADAGGLTGRNLIINGAMQVAQRGTSSTNQGYKTVDRFRGYHPTMGQLAYTQEQSTDAPDGFSNSYKWTVTTAETALSASEEWRIFTGLEGQDVQRLKFGTSDAKSFTVSFWVKSSVTGTYTLYILDNDNAYIITDTYTIDTADTWEHKSVTFVGNPNQSFDNDNNGSLYVQWILSAGSDYTSTDTTSWTSGLTGRAYGHTANIATTADATFQITGVQLEVGDKATPFEHRSYGDELVKCQRYYEVLSGDTSHSVFSGIVASNVIGSSGYSWPGNQFIHSRSIPMRTGPTATVTFTGTGSLSNTNSATVDSVYSINSRNFSDSQYMYFQKITFDAEL